MENEKRLIDANALKAEFPVIGNFKDDLWHSATVRLVIDNAPTVDAVVLPCKIGEKVFCILRVKNEIVEDVVEDYDIWSIKAGIKLRLSLLNHNNYVIAEFGKTVFLTREEAEAALAKMDGDGNA